MVWEALHCDRIVEQAALASGVAAALGIPAKDLSVADAIENADSNAKVLVAARPREGEFLMTVDIISGDDDVAERIDHDALRNMCTRWGCRGLVGDGSENPYRMILFSPGGADEAVYIEPEAFDERDEITIAGPASTLPAPKIPDAPRSQRRSTPPPPPRGSDEG